MSIRTSGTPHPALRSMAAASLFCVTLCVVLPLSTYAAPPASSPARTVHTSPDSGSRNGSIESAPNYAIFVDRYGPAVVNIRAAGDADRPAQLDAIAPDDPIGALLQSTASQQDQSPAARVMWGRGSGFIVSPDGLVVTTAHTVNRADEVTVTLTDRRQFKARVLGVDPRTDVALLQMQGASKLPVVRLGDAARVNTGETVLTIGALEGAQNTVTAGIVSVAPHALPDGTTFPFFQTEIAVNPDNSGGPLLNRDGAVIGVDVQLYVDAPRYQTMTFAIPIAAAIELRTHLLGQAKASGGSLGITTQDLDPGLATAFGLSRPQGVLVTLVAPTAHGTAANGLRAGDVITHVNGKSVDHAADLRDAVAGLTSGSKVTLKIVRNNKPMTLSATVAASTDAAAPSGDDLDRIGLVVHPLSEAERRTSGVEAGLLVDAASDLAADAGIEPGDIVVSVNGKPVASREALAALVASSPKVAALLIVRDNTRTFVSLKSR
ncbi:MAG TPA: trypsin-like peptidase domain-containing protein [Trinickia sp.]|uniref:trypsin-like peptidase domain-containing protein n=1 Tax=Trinickia sp. TaxID=2571163 RepID=UPI002F3F5B0A